MACPRVVDRAAFSTCCRRYFWRRQALTQEDTPTLADTIRHCDYMINATGTEKEGNVIRTA